MSDKPEVSLGADLQSMYGYYDMAPHQHITRAVHGVCGLIIHPRFSSDEEARTQLTETLQNPNERVVLSVNHVSNTDPFVIASLMHRLHDMRPMIAQTIIPSKPDYFTNPLTRWLWDAVGAKPVFREKDTKGTDSVDDTTRRRRAAQLYIKLVTKRMIYDVEHLTGFFEGSRNKADSAEVQPISRGIQTISENLVQEGIHPVIFPLAVAYDKRRILSWRSPRVHLGNPLRIETLNDCVNLRANMKDSLQRAVADARNKNIPHLKELS